MEVSRITTRNLPLRAPCLATALRNASLSPASFACSPMAVWSRRQFSSNPNSSFPGPPGMSLGGGPSSPTYFQRQTTLPANTIIRFVPQQTAWIVERMGKFNRILQPGLAILVPIIDVWFTCEAWKSEELTNWKAHCICPIVKGISY